jgi:integrase
MARKRKRTFKKTSIPGVTQVTNVDGTVKYKCQRRFGNGKRESKVFDSIIEAKKWFPDDEKKEQEILKHKSHTIVNGSYTDMTLRGLIDKWKKTKYSNVNLEAPDRIKGEITLIPEPTGKLCLSTGIQIEKRLNNLFDDDSVLELPLHEIDGEKIVSYINAKHIGPKRESWIRELKDLSGIFNWYIETYGRKNPTFHNPITKQVKAELAFQQVNQKTKKKESLSQEDLLRITKILTPGNLFHDLFKLQLTFGSRIGEMLGLKWTDIDFKDKGICFRHTAVFKGNHRFLGLQSLKNKSIEKLEKDLIPKAEKMFLGILGRSNSLYVFGLKEDEPVAPKKVRYEYYKILKNAGIDQKEYKGITHLMRHTSAQMVYNLTGNKEATQAHTGHKSIKMVERYAPLQPKSLSRKAMAELSENFLEE